MPSSAASSTLPATVTLPSEVVLDAIAGLHAFGNYMSEVRGFELEIDCAADSAVGEWADHLAHRVLVTAFGDAPDELLENGDEAWHRDPAHVETYVRGCTMAAELLRLHVEDHDDDFLYRAERMRTRAETVREAGTINA